MTTAEMTKPAMHHRSRVGTWLRNPVTGEVAQVKVGADDAAGRMVEADLWLQPDAAVVGAHVHDNLIESFEILEGEVEFELNGERLTAHPGDGPVVIPVGAVHDWWNSGPGIARAKVLVTAADGSPGRPAARFTEMIEVMWSLGALGLTDDNGMPGPLWLAAAGNEFRDVVRFVKPPALVQTLLFGPLSAIACLTGKDLNSPELRGPAAACVIPEPGEGELRNILERR